MNIKSFIFFDSVSSAGTSNAVSNSMGRKFVLQITNSASTGTFKFELQGKVDSVNGEYVSLFLTNENDGTQANSVTSEGIYSGSCNGVASLRGALSNVASAPSLSVFIRITD